MHALEKTKKQNKKQNALVTIGSFPEVYQAHLFRTYLAENNIESFISDEHIVSANWFYANAVGGLKVSVRFRNEQLAKQLLDEYGTMLRHSPEFDWGAIDPSWADDALPQAIQPSKHACQQCGCTQAQYETLARKWIFLSIFLLGIPVPFLSRTWICDRCGHRWKNQLF